jgi:hypothetical protein
VQLNCQRRDTIDRHIAGLRIVVDENHLAGMRVNCWRALSMAVHD